MTTADLRSHTPPQGAPSHAWHAQTTEQVLASFSVDEERGLSEEAARERLTQLGPNELPAPRRPSAVVRFLRQFHNMIIYVLLVSAVVTTLLQQWVETSVILGVVVINAVIGFLQEGKAERALESIRAMLSPVATVLRDGQRRAIPATEIVPGDIVLLKSGDRVPADLRVLEAQSAETEEASLTGESEPVEKQTAPVDEDCPLGDRKSLAFSSTLITSGRIRGVVVATGKQAEIGRISELMARVEEISTPLLSHINTFGRWLSAAIVLLALAIFLFGYLVQDFSAQTMFMVVVSLAVAAIPEGLPAVMTITLALGVQHMARQRAIVRRLPAVETLGSVTVACVDKTGTLTKNEMTVTEIACAGRLYTVTGTGYDPTGELLDVDRPVSPADHPWLEALARAAVLASDARLSKSEGAFRIEGAPTEGGLVVMAHKVGLDAETERQRRPRVDMIPFESERRFMASLHVDLDAGHVLYVKGAPERITLLCSHELTEKGRSPIDRPAWEKRERELASQGRRVLALAQKGQAGHWGDALRDDQVSDLVLLGFVALIDPPRPEAIEAIAVCQGAGVTVKMITGDHLLTARSIAASMGIGTGRGAIAGQELEQSDGEELQRLVQENDVFARSSPEHKLRIVEALKAQGHVVAMTGDGVNDAPALKRADVGVAMGIKGSEAAKEASEIVLADDNFATIERAVEEGRTIYDNLVKTILFILPTNGAQSLVVVASVFLALQVMPATPVQILWVNMVSAVTLALALAFEPSEEDVMLRPPRAPDEPILSRYLVWRVAYVSVLIAAVAILVFRWWLERGAEVAVARTTTINTLVSGQLFYLFNSRFVSRSSLSLRALTGNPAVFVTSGILIALQLAFTYLPPLQHLFDTAPLDGLHWASVVVAGSVVFLLVELEKAILRLRGSSRHGSRSSRPPRRSEGG